MSELITVMLLTDIAVCMKMIHNGWMSCFAEFLKKDLDPSLLQNSKKNSFFKTNIRILQYVQEVLSLFYLAGTPKK